MNKQFNIIIAGAGGIGSAAGLLLREFADFGVHLYLGDQFEENARKAAQWITEGSDKSGTVQPFLMPAAENSPQMLEIFKQGHIVLDCLPGSQAARIASLAAQYGLHYANLTEYVKATEAVSAIAKEAKTGFVLQTGLAPGFVNVLAMKLFTTFCQKFGVEQVDSIAMKVGALTKHAMPPAYYGFTWSPIGVATEYIEPAVVVSNYQKTVLPSLSERRAVAIDGIWYEEALTSGGAANLPDALANKTRLLDYKTLRYPGHYGWVEQTLAGFDAAAANKTQLLQAAMLQTIPALEDDVVVIYVSVQGKDQRGQLHLIEQSYRILPFAVGNKTLRAIQSTTASALAETARLLLLNNYQGLILQSQIDPSAFLNGRFVSMVYR
ncbi:saccharopine dehydrogenase [Sphingobacteriales bacterium UPWRP_1]|nr:saccharopine dehydrogenase [Sphingobacteriales bacterium TSM_CSM]PSJ73091.1 saccharopine dehydrogenase [Sphingobacteriales bacterium UPWRP_1]